MPATGSGGLRRSVRDRASGTLGARSMSRSRPDRASSTSFWRSAMSAGASTRSWSGSRTASFSGHSDYHYRHEPILYGYTAWSGTTRTGRPSWLALVWRQRRQQRAGVRQARPQPRASDHEAGRLGRGSAWPTAPGSGDVVYEPFAGSGSTLIAAEQTGSALLRDRDRSPLRPGDHRALAGLQRPRSRADRG